MKLFLGLIFLLLDIEIPVGPMQIGLLPDFVGCFLIMKDLEDRLDPWRHGAFVLTLVGAALYLAEFLHPGTGARVALWCLETAAAIGQLFLLYRITGTRKGTRELFPVLCCIRVLAMLLDWVPLVGTVCAAAGMVVALCFLAAAYRNLVKEP